MNPLFQRISTVESELAELQRQATRLSQTVTTLKQEVTFVEENKIIPSHLNIPESTPALLPVDEPTQIPPPEPIPLPELIPTHEEAAKLKMQLGRVWSVRLGILLLTTGFVFLSTPLAAVWAVLGTILLLTGLGLKSRHFRLLALIILLFSLGHLMVIDLVKLDPPPRILSFMTLGIGLLGLGFVYNRYQDRLKKIL